MIKLFQIISDFFVNFRKASLKFFGYKYIVNYHTSEIHVVSKLQTNCHVELMTNAKYVKSSKEFLENGYDGCRWCYEEANKE